MEKKIKLKLTNYEINVIIKALNELRNSQIQKGGITEPIDEVLIKLLK